MKIPQDEGFILEKKFGVGGLKRLENPKILIANTAMDHDKIKIFAAKVKTDDLATVAAIEKVTSNLSLLFFDAPWLTFCNYRQSESECMLSVIKSLPMALIASSIGN